jgi:hypothetical protein
VVDALRRRLVEVNGPRETVGENLPAPEAGDQAVVSRVYARRIAAT